MFYALTTFLCLTTDVLFLMLPLMQTPNPSNTQPILPLSKATASSTATNHTSVFADLSKDMSFPAQTEWMNDSICCLKRKGRKVALWWESTEMEAHFIPMKQLLSSFHREVKEARNAYFTNCDCNTKIPGALFSTVDRLVNSGPAATARNLIKAEFACWWTKINTLKEAKKLL